MGFIEAGASDFFVPRGYVHVIANIRGSGGSGGTFGFFDGQERRDMYDLVEWVARQPWSDGNVGMLKKQGADPKQVLDAVSATAMWNPHLTRDAESMLSGNFETTQTSEQLQGSLFWRLGYCLSSAG